MHQDRFYIPYTPTTQEVWIDGNEAHHIIRVKRAKQGEKITLFNGKGFEYFGYIQEIGKDTLKVFIEQTHPVDREAPVEITIAFSVPKGKHATFLIQKCAELGVKTLIPLSCERSVVDISKKVAEKIERWDKIVIEASKQCKRNLLTHIEEVMPFTDFIKTAGSYDLSIIACTGTDTITLKRVLHKHQQAKTILCLVGPEGGFTHNEVNRAKESGCIPISIGHSTLRIETAAIAVSSMILYAYSE